MRILWLACMAVCLTVLRPAAAADDDLEVVRRAVTRKASAEQGEPSLEARARSKDARWFKVRIVNKQTGREKVSMSLPLGLVEMVGEWPLDDCHGWRHGRCHDHFRRTLSDTLAALRSGRDLVQIDDEDTSVRVWVE